MRCARETGRAGSGWLRVAVSVATLIVAVLPWSAWGQAVDRLSVRMIGGRAVALVEVTHAGVTLPVQAVVDLGVRAPALLHERTAAALGIRGRAGAAVSVRFVADGVTWPSVTAVPVELEPLEELTRDHATELEDIPAAMVLGLPAFAGGVLDVDLAAGRLTLHGGEATLDGVLTASGVGRGNAGVTAMPFEAEAYGYWLDGQGPGGKRCRVRLSMGEGATRVNGDWAAGLGWPGGDLPSLSLGGLDLTQHAVLVPSDFSQLPAPLPDVSLGTRLLERFRLLVDAARGELVLVQTAEGPLDPRVRRYFAARVRGDADAVESFLQAGPPEAYAADAAEVLLAMRLDQSATVGDGAETGERGASEAEAQAALAAIDRAMGFMANWTAESARASRLIRVADDAIGLEGEHPLAFAVARLALARAQAGASADLDGTAAYHIQARLGLLALLEGDLTEARRRLLSAMFGLPRDPYINLWLGRLYEVSGQGLRAWSRYARSATADEPPIGAMRGLDRVFNDPTFRAGFSAAAARDLLEGQLDLIRTLPPQAAALASALEPGREAGSGFVLTFYVNADDPGAEQAMLAWEALVRQLPGARFVAFHTGDGLADDASARWLSDRGVPRWPALGVNGRVWAMPIELDGDSLLAWCYDRMAEAGRWPDATGGGVADRGGKHEGEDDQVGGSGLRARYAGGVVRLEGLGVLRESGGWLDLGGSSDSTSRRLRVWLVERVVFYPSAGASMFHPAVVRGALTREGQRGDDGASGGGRDGGAWSVDVGALMAGHRQRLALVDRLSGGVRAYTPGLIDPRWCSVVVASLDDRGRLARVWEVPVSVEEGAWP